MKVLITVKSPPYPSKTHRELVCTAGLTEQNKWIRLVPIPYRYLDDKKKYEKFDWIELEIEKHDKDHRSETFRPVDLNDIKVIGHIGTEDKWRERKKILAPKVESSLCKQIEEFREKSVAGKQYEAKSLFLIKPYEINNFIIEEDDPNWKPEWQQLFEQESLFEEMKMKPLNKIPYKFSYRFKCTKTCPGHKLKIEDWEIYELARKYLKKPDDLRDKVSKKYGEKFLNEIDIHFFIGSQLQWHRRKAKNPYLIIGVFYPKVNNQLSLFE